MQRDYPGGSLSPQHCEAIRRLAHTIRNHRDVHRLLAEIPELLREFADFDALAIARLRGESDLTLLLVDYQKNRKYEPPGPLSIEGSFTEWVLAHNGPLVIQNIGGEVRFQRSIGQMRELQLNAVCILPLATPHRNIGSFSVACERAGVYHEEQVHFLAFVADQIAMALDDALHSFELTETQTNLERRNDSLRLLLDLSNKFAANIDFRDLLRSVSGNLCSVMKSDEVCIALPDQETGKLLVYAILPHDSETSPLEGMPVSEEVARAFLQGTPVNVCTGVNAGVDSAKEGRDAPAKNSSAECHIPLSRAGRCLGLLTLTRKREEAFTEENIEFLSAVAQQVAIALENSLAYQEIQKLKDRLTTEKVYLEDEIRSETNFDEMIGQSAALKDVLRQVEVVAPTGSTVLICGDTGTGKELVARAIHNLSSRSNAPFVKLNCAAIPTGLLESELFGHERGAFTGAISQRIGRFEIASRGTVFLDEIGEVPLELQPKLLRVLQEREFERLGSSKTLTSGARLVAATNRDLAELVAKGQFRADLFYRLNVFPLQIPTLSQRKEDIPMLVRHFVRHFSQKMNKAIDTIPSEVMNALVQYHWPGNIRELQNVLERAVILSRGPSLNMRASDLPVARGIAADFSVETLEDAERKHILGALVHTKWVVAGAAGAAALLGLKRSTLQARMQRLGIKKP